MGLIFLGGRQRLVADEYKHIGVVALFVHAFAVLAQLDAPVGPNRIRETDLSSRIVTPDDGVTALVAGAAQGVEAGIASAGHERRTEAFEIPIVADPLKTVNDGVGRHRSILRHATARRAACGRARKISSIVLSRAQRCARWDCFACARSLLTGGNHLSRGGREISDQFFDLASYPYQLPISIALLTLT